MIEVVFEFIFKALVELAVFFGLSKFINAIKKTFHSFFRKRNNSKIVLVLFGISSMVSCINENRQEQSINLDKFKEDMQRQIQFGEYYCDTLIEKQRVFDTTKNDFYISQINSFEKRAKTIFDSVTSMGKQGRIKQEEYETFMHSINTDSIQSKMNTLQRMGVEINLR